MKLSRRSIKPNWLSQSVPRPLVFLMALITLLLPGLIFLTDNMTSRDMFHSSGRTNTDTGAEALSSEPRNSVGGSSPSWPGNNLHGAIRLAKKRIGDAVDTTRQFLDTTNREHRHVVSGEGTAWERVYAFASRANTEKSCGGHDRTFPMFSDGVAAGPKLCSFKTEIGAGGGGGADPVHGGPTHAVPCTATTLEELDSSMLLAQGEAVRFHPGDQVHYRSNPQVLANVVKDRERHSSASGVVFLNDEYFALVSMGIGTLYLYHYEAKTMQVTLLDKIVNRIPGSKGGGGPDGAELVELVDYDGRDLLVTGNLLSASFTVFQLDWDKKKLKLVTGAFPLQFPESKRQMTHGVRFYPTSKDVSHIVATTAVLLNHADTMMVRIYDWHRNQTLAELQMKDSPYAGLSPKDVFFIDKYNMLVGFTNSAVTGRLGPGEDCRPPHEGKNHLPISAYFIHFRLNFDLDEDDCTGNEDQCPVHRGFTELQRIEYKLSHVDSISYRDGIALVSDQFNDVVTLVAVDPAGEKAMKHIDTLSGFHMNHGVALAPNMEYMAVTQYGDNSVVVSKFPKRVQQGLALHRTSVASIH